MHVCHHQATEQAFPTLHRGALAYKGIGACHGHENDEAGWADTRILIPLARYMQTKSGHGNGKVSVKPHLEFPWPDSWHLPWSSPKTQLEAHHHVFQAFSYGLHLRPNLRYITMYIHMTMICKHTRT